MEKGKLVSLVTAAQNGDKNATNQLFNEFYNDLYYFALKTVKDDDLALDITQDAFIEIINTLGNLKEPAAFVTWAKQITYHQCTRYFRKKKDVLADEDEDGKTVFDDLKEESAEFIPDEALDQNDFKKTILSILDELSEEQRSAVMMYYFDEMSVGQIAEIQGVSAGTVKSRLNYARKAIKESVEDYEKKNGIKLHAIPFFPFFKWLFNGSFSGGIPAAAAQTIANGVSAATGTTVTTAVAATAATATAAATTTAAVGVGAKIAIPLGIKLIAAGVAAAVVIGGATTAVVISNNNKKNNEDVVAMQDDEENDKDDGKISGAEAIKPQQKEELLLGEYEGTYVDNFMKETFGEAYDSTPIVMTFSKQGEKYIAVVAFHDLPSLVNPTGSFCYNVLYDANTDEYVFTEASDMEYANAGVYLQKPLLYPAPNLRGKLVGDVLSGETPTKFSVTRRKDADGELVLQGIIPQGCTYTLADGTVLVEGDSFPKKCTAGDVVEYGDYIYGYECIYSDSGDGTGEWHLWNEGFDSGDSGVIDIDVFGSWSVAVNDKSKQSYGDVAAKINGKPIKTLYATYYDCKQMVNAPRIPSTVTAMTATYYGCSSLEKAPTIPSNVQRIMVTFYGCTALTGNVEINATLDKSLEWFYSDTFGLTTGAINLIGATPEEDLILIAKASDNPNITVNGKSYNDDGEQPDDSVDGEVGTDEPDDMEEEITLDEFARSKANKYVSSRLLYSGLPYFSSVDELPMSNAFWFAFYGIDKEPYFDSEGEDGARYYTIPISVLNTEIKNIFGTEYDLSTLDEYDLTGTWQAIYTVADIGEDFVILISQGGAGTDYHPEITSIDELGDDRYQVNISWYSASAEEPTDENADYYYDGNSTYWIADKWEKMTLQCVEERIDNSVYMRVQIVSYSEQ